ncbi:MAG: VF530 family protein [Verrucomicrobiae bacterium]
MPGAEGGDLQAGSASPPQRKHPRDPLHGITLERILNQLLEQHGWDEMGRRISIRCFQTDPSVKSSLTFLRKTPWARQKVEDWFIEEQWNRRTKGR